MNANIRVRILGDMAEYWVMKMQIRFPLPDNNREDFIRGRIQALYPDVNVMVDDPDGPSRSPRLGLQT